MRFNREHDPIEDTQFFDTPLDSSFEMPSTPSEERQARRERREVSFRERDKSRPARPSRPRGSGRDPRDAAGWKKWAVGIAAVATIAVLAGWGIASVYRANADSSAAAAVAVNSAANAKTASAKKVSSKKPAKAKRKSSSATSKKASSKATTASKAVAKTAKPAAARTVASAASARTVASVSSGQVVVIDAGHQAHGDSSLEPIGPGSSSKKPKVADGASGSHSPRDESAVNLAVALKLRTALQARGVKVIMVRTSQDVNISNSQRAAIANKAKAALFVRLHCDGIGNSSTNGFTTLVPASNAWTAPIVSASSKAGHLVQSAAIKATGARDAGVVSRGDLSGFNWSKVPTVLVEMGFMSNSAEDAKLTSSAYQQKLAAGIADGTVQYLKSR